MNLHFNFNTRRSITIFFPRRRRDGNNHCWRAALLACWYNNDPAHVVRLHVHGPIYEVVRFLIQINSMGII